MRAFGRPILLAWVLGSALACLSAAEARGAGQLLSQMGHTAWRVKDGLFPSANAIAQTKDGYLWLGTDRGLVRFDGVRFVPWNTFPEGSSADWTITALHAARDGSLWIGTTGQTVAAVRDGHLAKQSVKGRVGEFAEDAAGNVWYAMTRANGQTVPLCRTDRDEVKCAERSDLALVNASSVVADPDGSLWVAGGVDLCRWHPGEATRCHRKEALDPFRGLVGFAAQVLARDGTHWVGFARGGKDLGLGQLVQERWKASVVDGLDTQALSVTSLLEDTNGALWVGTLDRGVYRIRDGRADHLDRMGGLSSDSVASNGLLEDREGTIWVVTSAGVDAFRRVPVSVFSTREGLSADRVDSVLPTRDGAVWIGGTGLTRLVDDRPSTFSEGERFASANTTSLLEDHAGRVWVGVNNTLDVLTGGRVVRLGGPQGGDTRIVEFMAEDARHRVWAVTQGPPLLLRFSGLDPPELLPEARADGLRSMAPDAAGGMWLGYADGTLVHAHDDQWTAYPTKGKVLVRSIEVGPDGLVAAATSRGVVLQKGERQWLLDAAHGLSCDRARGIVFDARADLWVSANCGLMKITAGELATWMAGPQGKAAVRLFDETDGVQIGDGTFTPHAIRAHDGRLWFATGKVAQVIDPAEVSAVPKAPPVRVEQIVADRSAYDAGDLVDLPARTRDLEIHYTALSFVAPQRIRFRYRLDGHDRAWREADTRRTAFYNDLAPGNYRFLVEAAATDGTWSDRPASIRFAIPPMFYQTTWFAALCVVATLALLYGLYRLRVRALDRRLRDRLGVRLAERERIARELHDTLLQSTQGLVFHFQAIAGELAPDSPARERIEQTLKRADTVMEEGRDRVMDLRLPSESLADLPEALAVLGDELAKVHPARFSTVIEGARRPLDRRAHDALYHIGREALVNAFRHAQARNVEVEIAYARDALSLRVRDDGVGISPETVAARSRPGHWGLKGLGERASGIGAVLEVWSRVGAGTEIGVDLPAAVAYPDAPRRSFPWLQRLLQSTALRQVD